MKLSLATAVLLAAVGIIAANSLAQNARRADGIDRSIQSLKDGFNGTIWAVLVAGSNGYYNYRHQADICHAYQVLKKHGLSDENIIVLMYDDIANSEENPRPGTIINKPGGPNVYPGVPKDYIQEDVTPKNFLRVLDGDPALAASGKKVLKSGPNDHVFIYFADHGAPGLVGFPDDTLSATDFNKQLKKLHKDNKYEKLVVYIEACESGSMFDGLLPDNINIFATTAANGEESSYACYWSDVYQAYLGDVYSVKWIEDSEAHPSLKSETLQQQFQTVKKETTTSHVQEYGDKKLGSLPLSLFQGAKTALTIDKSPVAPITDAVPSEDVPLYTILKRIGLAKDEATRKRLSEQYQQLIDGRAFLIKSMQDLAKELVQVIDTPFEQLWNEKRSLRNHECYERLVDAFNNHCFKVAKHIYSFRFLYVFANYCEAVGQTNKPAISTARHIIQGYCRDNVYGLHPFHSIQ